MNKIISVFNTRKLLLVTCNVFINKNSSFSYFNSKKPLFHKSSTFLSLFICNHTRKYMDLKSVIKIIEEKIPSHLSEGWDNTGLLVEPSNKDVISTILFTNDLTEVVLEEALSLKPDLIISYHPPIFAPMKALRMSNWKDRIVIKCLENSIAVYSPHTSCDALNGGVNDWLISCFDMYECHPIHTSFESKPKYLHIVDFIVPLGEDICQRVKSIPDSELYDRSINSDSQRIKLKVNESSLCQIVQLVTEISNAPISVTSLNPLPIPACGMGRIAKLTNPLSLGECIKLVKSHLKLHHIRFSQSACHTLESEIKTVAVCAGSGSSVLKGTIADLYITGEMSHHDLLDANHNHISVILCEHSNSERGYLKHLADSLNPVLKDVKMIISSTDKDPITII